MRPIHNSERTRWNDLMKAHHYLGFRVLTGESIRYVAEWDGDWLALIGWGCAAFKSGPRDRWIGWSQEQQWQRLKFVACNQRFLILPGVQIPNLASRVLSLNTKRLPLDWLRLYGHKVVLAETFVDPSRFAGTCYQAAGWARLGQTRGFGRNAGCYFYHGQPKTVFVFPLMSRARSLLSDAFLSPELEGGQWIVDVNELELQGENGLVAVLAGITDSRRPRGVRHGQASILTVGVCACLCGQRSYAAMTEWVQRLTQDILKRLGCPWNYRLKKYVPPSEPTLRRTLQTVDASEVDRRVGKWMLSKSYGDAIAIDGKTLRGSKKGNGKPVHLLSAFVQGEGSVVGQQGMLEKSNEITAARPLLEPLDLEGKVVTADAMHTQREFARWLKEDKGANYVFTVKDNQPTLLKDIQSLDDQAFSPSVH